MAPAGAGTENFTLPLVPSLREALQKYSAVVVTGGSSGIGKSFIELIGSLRPDVALCNLSRSVPDLKFPKLKLRHFTCDLASPAAIEGTVSGLVAHLNETAPQGSLLLINNSGFGIYGDFPGPDPADQVGMLDVNVRAVLQLTAALLPELRRRGGAIINVASTAAFQPTPHLAVYGATKAFLLHWSLALREELRGSGIHVLAVCPGPTSSNFFKRAGLEPATNPKSRGMTCEAVVEQSLRALAAGRGQVITGWRNRIGAMAGSTAPPAVSARIAKRVIEKHRLARLKK